jgi:hypothetical protein
VSLDLSVVEAVMGLCCVVVVGRSVAVLPTPGVLLCRCAGCDDHPTDIWLTGD